GTGWVGSVALWARPPTLFWCGFMTFEFGLGFALFGMASGIPGEHRRWQVRLAIHALFVCALFVAHLFALGVYGLVLGLYELRRMFVGRLEAVRAAAIVAMLAGPVLVPLLILYATGGARGPARTRGGVVLEPREV